MKPKNKLAMAVTRQGDFSLPVDAGRIAGTFVTQSGSLFCMIDGPEGSAGQTVLLWSGEGQGEIDFHMPGTGLLMFSASDPNVFTSFWLHEWRGPAVVTGWTEGESFAQLDVKSRDTIAPEIRSMMETMQRNMLMREMQLRSEISRLQK